MSSFLHTLLYHHLVEREKDPFTTGFQLISDFWERKNNKSSQYLEIKNLLVDDNFN